MEGGGGGEGDYIPIATLSPPDFYIKMGSDENHFNVSVGSDGQNHKTVSPNHNLFEEKGEPKRYRNRGPSAYEPNALPLGQTGSQCARERERMGVYPVFWVAKGNGQTSPTTAVNVTEKSCLVETAVIFTDC